MIIQGWNEVDMGILPVKENYLYPTHILYYFYFFESPNVHKSIETELISAI